MSYSKGVLIYNFNEVCTGLCLTATTAVQYNSVKLLASHNRHPDVIMLHGTCIAGNVTLFGPMTGKRMQQGNIKTKPLLPQDRFGEDLQHGQKLLPYILAYIERLLHFTLQFY